MRLRETKIQRVGIVRVSLFRRSFYTPLRVSHRCKSGDTAAFRRILVHWICFETPPARMRDMIGEPAERFFIQKVNHIEYQWRMNFHCRVQARRC